MRRRNRGSFFSERAHTLATWLIAAAGVGYVFSRLFVWSAGHG